MHITLHFNTVGLSTIGLVNYKCTMFNTYNLNYELEVIKY